MAGIPTVASFNYWMILLCTELLVAPESTIAIKKTDYHAAQEKQQQ